MIVRLTRRWQVITWTHPFALGVMIIPRSAALFQFNLGWVAVALEHLTGEPCPDCGEVH